MATGEGSQRKKKPRSGSPQHHNNDEINNTTHEGAVVRSDVLRSLRCWVLAGMRIVARHTVFCAGFILQSRRTPARGGLFLEGAEKEPHNTTKSRKKGEKKPQGFLFLCVCCATTKQTHCTVTPPRNQPARKGIIWQSAAPTAKNINTREPSDDDEPAHRSSAGDLLYHLFSSPYMYVSHYLHHHHHHSSLPPTKPQHKQQKEMIASS